MSYNLVSNTLSFGARAPNNRAFITCRSPLFRVSWLLFCHTRAQVSSLGNLTDMWTLWADLASGDRRVMSRSRLRQLASVVLLLTFVVVARVDADNATNVSPSLSSVNETDLSDDYAPSYGSGSGSSDDDGTYVDDYDGQGSDDQTGSPLIAATCGTTISLSSATTWKWLRLTVPHAEKYTFYLGGDVTYVINLHDRAHRILDSSFFLVRRFFDISTAAACLLPLSQGTM